MPMPARNTAEPLNVQLPPAPRQPSVVIIDGGAATWVESPARLLHDRLVESFAAPEMKANDAVEAFPAAVRLAILLGSVTFLWSIIGGIVLLLR